MNYTLITLALLGLFGIFIHNLKNLNALNKKSDGELNLGKYLKLEIYAILLSICVVAVALIAQQEIKQLEAVGKWFAVQVGCGRRIGCRLGCVFVKLQGLGRCRLRELQTCDNFRDDFGDDFLLLCCESGHT